MHGFSRYLPGLWIRDADYLLDHSAIVTTSFRTSPFARGSVARRRRGAPHGLSRLATDKMAHTPAPRCLAGSDYYFFVAFIRKSKYSNAPLQLPDRRGLKIFYESETAVWDFARGYSGFGAC